MTDPPHSALLSAKVQQTLRRPRCTCRCRAGSASAGAGDLRMCHECLPERFIHLFKQILVYRNMDMCEKQVTVCACMITYVCMMLYVCVGRWACMSLCQIIAVVSVYVMCLFMCRCFFVYVYAAYVDHVFEKCRLVRSHSRHNCIIQQFSSELGKGKV